MGIGIDDDGAGLCRGVYEGYFCIGVDREHLSLFSFFIIVRWPTHTAYYIVTPLIRCSV